MDRYSRLSNVAALATAMAASVAWAGNGDIRIQFAPDQCQATIARLETRTLYVYAVLDGSTLDGITGVEYSMQFGSDNGPDPGWMFDERFVANSAVWLGSGSFSPPDHHVLEPRRNRGRGVNVAWATCQQGENRMVLVETVQVTNLEATQPLRVLVVDHDTPSNQFFRCPLATLCDAPYFTKVCLGDNVVPCVNPEGPSGPAAQCSTSSAAVIDPSGASANPCHPTAVKSSTWSGVKTLFR